MLTEQQVLKQLDIPDFRHLSKTKVINLASMLPKMNPEVAKKALEQFPDFVSSSLEFMREYKGIVEKSLADNTEDNKTCYDMYNRVMDSLQKMLDKDDLSFEERKYILEQIREVAQRVDEKNSENKKFLLKVIGMAGAFALGVVAVLGSVLGSDIGAKTYDEDNDSFE